MEVRTLERYRRLVRDRGEELEVALVVGGRATALGRDRADERVLLAKRRDDDGLLDHRSPGFEIGQAQAARVSVDLPQKERAAIDGRADEGSPCRPVDGLGGEGLMGAATADRLLDVHRGHGS